MNDKIYSILGKLDNCVITQGIYSSYKMDTELLAGNFIFPNKSVNCMLIAEGGRIQT